MGKLDWEAGLILAILTSHPIQYQVPLWQALARDGRVPFEVWYLTRHGLDSAVDREFGRAFAWDIDSLAGYEHRFLDVATGAAPGSFWKCRLRESLRRRMKAADIKAVWIQGWQVAAYWQAVREAKAAGVEVWLRGESNDLAPTPKLWKRRLKRHLLSWLFGSVDRFLCIGAANKRLYSSYSVPSTKLYEAPYAVDNDRFAAQADGFRGERLSIRRKWGISDDACCLLFCGKFIPKKRPEDLIKATMLLLKRRRHRPLHLLFVGTGELGRRLRESCCVVFDHQDPADIRTGLQTGPKATFAGFLNQNEIARAYVAADCLVLPSDHGETWGLVVNEAMASGCPAVVSDQCGCAEDLPSRLDTDLVFRAGDTQDLARAIAHATDHVYSPAAISRAVAPQHLQHTVDSIFTCYKKMQATANVSRDAAIVGDSCNPNLSA